MGLIDSILGPGRTLLSMLFGGEGKGSAVPRPFTPPCDRNGVEFRCGMMGHWEDGRVCRVTAVESTRLWVTGPDRDGYLLQHFVRPSAIIIDPDLGQSFERTATVAGL